MQDFLNAVSHFFMQLQDKRMTSIEDKYAVKAITSDCMESYKQGYNDCVKDFQASCKKALDKGY